jgi:hypothetical protein
MFGIDGEKRVRKAGTFMSHLAQSKDRGAAESVRRAMLNS